MKHTITSEITGKIWRVLRQVGDTVQAGDEIAIIESMKMEFPVTAPVAGTLVALAIEEGQAVTEEQVLGEIEA